VRARQRLAGGGAAELVGDHGLAGRVRLARGGRKRARVAHGLEEEQDDARLGIVGEEADDLADAEVGLVADRDELGEPQAARGAAREHRAEHGAALRDEARAAGGRRLHLEHRVHRERHAPGEVDHAHAVRPEQAHAERARALDEARLALGAFRARVGEAVAVDARHRHLAPAAVLERRLDVLDHDEGVVDSRGVGEAAVAGQAEDFTPGRIHREHLAGVAVLHQEALRAGGVLLRVARGADQRHGVGGE